MIKDMQTHIIHCLQFVFQHGLYYLTESREIWILFILQATGYLTTIHAFYTVPVYQIILTYNYKNFILFLQMLRGNAHSSPYFTKRLHAIYCSYKDKNE